MELIDKLNFLGNEPTLYINNKNRYTNCISIFMGTLSLLAILSLSLTFIINFLNGKNFNMVTNQSTKLSPSLDLSKVPLMFRVNSVYGDIYPENITQVVVQKWTFLQENLSKPVITTYPVERCDRDKHLSNLTDIVKDFQVEKYYCISNNVSNNLTIYGRAQDTINTNSYLMIYALKCVNDSKYNLNNAVCESDTTIESKLGTLPHFFNFAILDNSIDNDNLEKPISNYIRTFNPLVGLRMSYRHLLYLKKVFYNSDNGFIFEDINTKEFHQFDKQITEVTMNPFTLPGAFSALTITFSEVGDFHTRTFEKLQTLIANISGIFRGIILIATTLTQIFSNKLFLEYINNHISSHIQSSSQYTDSSHNNLITYKSIRPFSTIIPREIVQKEIKKENNEEKKISHKINLTKLEILCPSSIMKNSVNLKLLYEFENNLKNKLSIENILMLILNLEYNFKTGLLKELLQNKNQINLPEVVKDSKIESPENKLYILGNKKN